MDIARNWRLLLRYWPLLFKPVKRGYALWESYAAVQRSANLRQCGDSSRVPVSLVAALADLAKGLATERLRYMLEDSAPRVVLTQDQCAASLPATTAAQRMHTRISKPTSSSDRRSCKAHAPIAIASMTAAIAQNNAQPCSHECLCRHHTTPRNSHAATNAAAVFRLAQASVDGL